MSVFEFRDWPAAGCGAICRTGKFRLDMGGETVRFDNDGLVDVFFSNGAARTFNDSDIPRPDSALIGQPEWNYYEAKPTRPEQHLAPEQRRAAF